MRAEAHAFINRIEAALALVRLSLDWERALRRLDELNARVQDPSLWDNPKMIRRPTKSPPKWPMRSNSSKWARPRARSPSSRMA
jgi:hypothetical protein